MEAVIPGGRLMLRSGDCRRPQDRAGGVREMLADELGFAWSSRPPSGEEALQQLREQPRDVLLLDLSLPGQSGWMCLRRRASATRR